ncbi:hypothetical protein BKA62DRAFT_74120 [Auriculariales sp. MPI-PUGE-AT-0066]|nr:hypothetical protein BKA62DRAFT_74120 [Auriculariales sp. MPI-PUGE-AT-0066]
MVVRTIRVRARGTILILMWDAYLVSGSNPPLTTRMRPTLCGVRVCHPRHPALSPLRLVTCYFQSMREYQLVIIGGGGQSFGSRFSQSSRSNSDLPPQSREARASHPIRPRFLCAQYDPTIADTPRKQCIIDGEAVVLDVLDTSVKRNTQHCASNSCAPETDSSFYTRSPLAPRSRKSTCGTNWRGAPKASGATRRSRLSLSGTTATALPSVRSASLRARTLPAALNCGFVEASAKKMHQRGRGFLYPRTEIKRHNSAQAQVVHRR